MTMCKGQTACGAKYAPPSKNAKITTKHKIKGKINEPDATAGYTARVAEARKAKQGIFPNDFVRGM